jgi:hypothetical protein
VSNARTRVSAAKRVDVETSTGKARIVPRKVNSVSSEGRNLRFRCAAVVVTVEIPPFDTDTAGDPVAAPKRARGQIRG